MTYREDYRGVGDPPVGVADSDIDRIAPVCDGHTGGRVGVSGAGALGTAPGGQSRPADRVGR